MSRPPEVVLGEFAALAISIETHHKAVVIDANDRTVGSLAIRGGAGRNNDVTVDGDPFIFAAYVPDASRVEAPFALLSPSHDATTASRPVIGSSEG